MANDREHFDSYREQTRVKHTILEKYAPSFFHVLKQQHPSLVYIDGFAGRGIYLDAASATAFDGSPLRALKAVAKVAELSAQVSMVFIERDPKLAEELRASVSAFCAENKHVREPMICQGEFAAELPRALEELNRRGLGAAPTFLFVDPCGVAGVDFSVIERYLNQPRCEALIFFNLDGVRRILGLGTRMGATLGELLGSEHHAKELARRVEVCTSPVAREECIVSYYIERLRTTKATYITAFRVEKEDRRITSHYLVHATSHPRGFAIMKDVMWSVGKTAEGQGGLALEQASGRDVPLLLLRPRWEAIKGEVLRELRDGNRRVSYFYDELVSRPANRLSGKAYRAALLELEAAGSLIVLSKDGSKPAPASSRPKRKGLHTLGEGYHVALSDPDLAEVEADDAQEGECLRCHAATPIFTYSCQSCDSGGERYGGEEAYRAGDLWYLVDHDPESRGDPEPMRCEFCESTEIDIEFESMCGYCEHMMGGD